MDIELGDLNPTYIKSRWRDFLDGRIDVSEFDGILTELIQRYFTLKDKHYENSKYLTSGRAQRIAGFMMVSRECNPTCTSDEILLDAIKDNSALEKWLKEQKDSARKELK